MEQKSWPNGGGNHWAKNSDRQANSTTSKPTPRLIPTRPKSRPDPEWDMFWRSHFQELTRIANGALERNVEIARLEEVISRWESLAARWEAVVDHQEKIATYVLQAHSREFLKTELHEEIRRLEESDRLAKRIAPNRVRKAVINGSS